MNFIKKIFENKIDEDVHKQFTKFGKGTFENKALVEINVTSKNIKIKTSAEFTNELVKLLAETIKNPTEVKGIIFSTKDLSKESDIFEEVKSAMGVRKHFVDKELTKEQILELYEKFPHASLNLSFKTDYGELKVKEKAPKSSKPGKGDKEPKADYCKFTTKDKKVIEDYAFDVKQQFKKLFVKHTFEIKDLEIPKEYENDFAKARLYAKRKGTIQRFLNIDGTKKESKKEFKA